jgi:hypothetical protein
MYTSFLSLSLLLVPVANTTPAWQSNYATALDIGQKQGRPVAVFVGSGTKGLAQLVKEGQLSDEAYQLLANRYVCVYLDQTNGGHRLARDFGITQGTGIVISDRSGSFQAYHHDGKLSQTELTQRLRQFADPGLVVNRTVSNGNSRISHYGDPSPRTIYSPSAYTPAVRVNC